MKSKRSFEAGSGSRLLEDWQRRSASPSDAIRYALQAMQARSRDLYNNASYVRGFYRRLERNVVGPNGIRLQSRLKRRNGQRDRDGAKALERSFRRWSKLGNCTVCGRHSLRDVEALVIRSIARDGEILIREIEGRQAGNEWGYALQIIEAEHLDWALDERYDAQGVRRIRMGVELNPWGRPVGYHVLTLNPFEGHAHVSGRNRVRVPASRLIHPFVHDYASQVRGIPWFHAAMADARTLEKYREAELIAARIAASKGGYLIGDDDEEESEGESGYDDPTELVEPGTIKRLAPGTTFTPVDLDHPNDGFADFEKAILRGIAASLGISYVSFANDLEGVSYSSARQGMLDERDEYRQIQGWLVEHVLDRVFRGWLRNAALRPGLLPNRPLEDMEDSASWQARGWSWIDPKKEAEGAALELDRGMTTLTRLHASRGEDFEDVLEERAAEIELADELGVDLTPPTPAPQPGPDEREETTEGGE